MSLLFDASGENIDCGTGTSLDNLDPVTIIVWAYFTTWGNGAGNDSRIFFKNNSSTAQLRFTGLVTNTELNLSTGRATTQAEARAAVANFSAYATGKWLCLVGQNDLTTTGNNRLFMGDRLAVVAEPSIYITQTEGFGAAGSTSGATARIGSNAGAAFVNGRIAFCGVWNRVLSLGELTDQQFRPHVTAGCKLFMFPGANGTGTQPDWSGNGNAGTVTGATVDVGVPLGSIFGFDSGLPIAIAGRTGLISGLVKSSLVDGRLVA